MFSVAALVALATFTYASSKGPSGILQFDVNANFVAAIDGSGSLWMRSLSSSAWTDLSEVNAAFKPTSEVNSTNLLSFYGDGELAWNDHQQARIRVLSYTYNNQSDTFTISEDTAKTMLGWTGAEPNYLVGRPNGDLFISRQGQLYYYDWKHQTSNYYTDGVKTFSFIGSTLIATQFPGGAAVLNVYDQPYKTSKAITVPFVPVHLSAAADRLYVQDNKGIVYIARVPLNPTAQDLVTLLGTRGAFSVFSLIDSPVSFVANPDGTVSFVDSHDSAKVTTNACSTIGSCVPNFVPSGLVSPVSWTSDGTTTIVTDVSDVAWTVSSTGYTKLPLAKGASKAILTGSGNIVWVTSDNTIDVDNMATVATGSKTVRVGQLGTGSDPLTQFSVGASGALYYLYKGWVYTIANSQFKSVPHCSLGMPDEIDTAVTLFTFSGLPYIIYKESNGKYNLCGNNQCTELGQLGPQIVVSAGNALYAADSNGNIYSACGVTSAAAGYQALKQTASVKNIKEIDVALGSKDLTVLDTTGKITVVSASSLCHS